MARVLQEQERELYFIAQQNSNFYGDQGNLAFQERSLNSLQRDESDSSELNDEQFAARLQAEEMTERLYYDSNGTSRKRRRFELIPFAPPSSLLTSQALQESLLNFQKMLQTTPKTTRYRRNLRTR